MTSARATMSTCWVYVCISTEPACMLLISAAELGERLGTAATDTAGAKMIDRIVRKMVPPRPATLEVVKCG